jgi:hypothetical protein
MFRGGVADRALACNLALQKRRDEVTEEQADGGGGKGGAQMKGEGTGSNVKDENAAENRVTVLAVRREDQYEKQMDSFRSMCLLLDCPTALHTYVVVLLTRFRCSAVLSALLHIRLPSARPRHAT